MTADDVFKAMAATGNTPRWMLRSGNKAKYVVKDRAAVSIVLREMGMSWPMIGRELNRDHASPMRLAEKYKDDKDVNAVVEEVCAKVGIEIQINTGM